MNPDAQAAAILRHLRSGWTLTSLDALELFDCMHLQGRIYDLRKAGHNIVTDWLVTESGKRVGQIPDGQGGRRMKGYVYILTNEHMPGLVKIGKTTRDPKGRAAELYQTGVPTPFKVEASVLSPDCAELESMVHEHLAQVRLSPNREFFCASVGEANVALVARHSEQISLWFDEFLPGHTFVESELFIDPADIWSLADRVDEHPFDVAAAFYLIRPEEFRPAITRWHERVAKRQAESSGEDDA